MLQTSKSTTSCKANRRPTASGGSNLIELRVAGDGRDTDAGPRRRQRVGRLDQLQKGRARQRRSEHEALRRADAVVAQVGDLLEVLDALGNDRHAQIAREV